MGVAALHPQEPPSRTHLEDSQLSGEPNATCPAFSQSPKDFACVPFGPQKPREGCLSFMAEISRGLGGGVWSRQSSELGAEPDQGQPFLAPPGGLEGTLP